MSNDAKFHKDVESEKGTIISDLWSLLEQIQWLLPKMGQMKPHQNMTYCTSPGPVFHVDSGSEVRIPIFCLWHPIWPTLCESTPWMIDLATADVPTVITVSPAVRSLSYMYKVWIKRACIKFPSIACDGNPPVTHGDFDNISPIWRGYHHQYHCAMHVTHHIWWA